ncbi:MAG TPA: Tex family protein [Syntrophales bacterium]|nr:Tex family protein [Syntrophales bacterium]HPK17611.1 Tex family protein [Syntrophales bacterium]HQG82507.1 Tex family protein [Syntrophales bacterium]
MQDKHIARIAAELSLAPGRVRAVAGLLEEGGTVPFIARYRKEATGSLDEVAITGIRDRLEQLAELDKRREAILKSLEERQLLTDELKEKVNAAETMAALEDVYLPFRPKRRTRATVAKEKGLEPLAAILFAQDAATDPAAEAAAFVDAEKGVETVDDALAGARDIIAEWVNENQEARARIRDLFAAKGVFKSKVIADREAEGAKFRDYFAWEEPVASAPSHRVLAMRRGENEKILSLGISPPEEEALKLLEEQFVTGQGPASGQVREAVHDGYRRLLCWSMETEIRLETKKRADEAAIRVFADNLRQLLLAPPLGQKNVLAIDPGFRTGCKVVCLDRQGKLLHNDTIFPHFSEEGKARAAETIRELVGTFSIEAVAVGNGTAGRETEAFVRGLGLAGIPVILVNESGASVYSASNVARDEFPDHDVTVRGAVSIGRRLVDPLAELVKIDPKAIGVGQYQHDVDQGALKRSLDDVVSSCVNAVGVEVNTASPQLLTYVSGLGPQLAANIVAYRNEHGPFEAREGLRKVPRLGPKAFEQAAGFLRIRGGKNPLDASAVHPESYAVVEAMARDLECSVTDLVKDEAKRKAIDIAKYVSDKVGIPTLKDIVAELARPGRDPRETFEPVTFAEGIEKPEDLRPGMKLPGVVTNVTAFGAFVDVGVHQDGLVHVSQLADRYVSDPNQVVKVAQRVEVTVLDVDLERKRISLSMKKGATGDRKAPPAQADQERGPRPERRPERSRQDRQKQEKKKPEPAPFNNPFARAFGKGKPK